MVTAQSELRDLLLRRAARKDERPGRRGFRFKSCEAFVVAHGRGYTSAPLTDGERELLRGMLDEHGAQLRRGFELKQCFKNSQELHSLDTTGSVVYVEGYVWAYGDGIPPVHHAWLTLHRKVVDVTVVTRALLRREKLLEEPLRILGEFEGRAYWGVPFRRSHFAFRQSLNRGFRSLLDDDL